jgi:hypothetical protein
MRTLTPKQKRTLDAVFDEIIPPSADGKLPGAGSLGLAEEIESQTAFRWPAIEDGLAKLDELARLRGGVSFAGLPDEQRSPVLNELTTTHPTLLPSLIYPTLSGYYRAAPVMEALGRERRSPHPEGYELEPGDLSLLDPVRVRPTLYREV